MPLLKRKPFQLAEAPNNLNPEECVFQVRFTKEIFRQYEEYVNRINLYRQRVWTCKVSGKVNLTYEEALVSERRAAEKVQQFPKELMEPALKMIQFSTLTLSDLVSSISARLQERFLEGAELYGRKENTIHPCKILKVRVMSANSTSYEVGWLDKNKNVTGTSTLASEDLVRKKIPFSRDLLKSFIRESTSRSLPWVVHEDMARKYGISIEPPVELLDKFSLHDQHGKTKDGENRIAQKKKKRKLGSQSSASSETWDLTKEEQKLQEEPIKYPIDDLLVKPGADDPVFTDRPTVNSDFHVPVECVGDLLMVWNFCSSFGRLLHLWPFSLEDFENAICHKDTNLILTFESHSVLLQLLIKDEGAYFTSTQKKKRKSKITLMNWGDYLCDFLEMKDVPELSSHMGTIKRGHYGLLDPHAKLHILRELVSEVLSTDAVRQQLDEYIEQRQILGAAKRKEAIEEGRKKRNEKESKQEESDSKEVVQNIDSEKNGGRLQNFEDKSYKQNGNVPKTKGFISSNGIHSSSAKKSKHMIADKESLDFRAPGSLKEDFGMLNDKKTGRRKNNGQISQESSTKEQKKEQFEREVEKRFIRVNPLGKDRNYNRYWFFRRDGRIFVESSDSEHWGYYTSKEELDMLMGSLNPKGERELALKKQLEKNYLRLCAALEKRSRAMAQRLLLDDAVLRRSTRVQARPKEEPSLAFLKYVNKWK